MGKPALLVVSALALWALMYHAAAQEQAPAAAPKPAASGIANDVSNRVAGYTAWDDEYFYIAVQVNKSTVSAKNSAPFSRPLEDDATIVSLQMDDEHTSVKRTSKTYTIAVSAANGFQLYSGAEGAPLFASLEDFNDRLKEIVQTEKDPVAQQKKLLALQGRVVKVKVVQKGAARAGGDFAPGYTVEIAVPWADLGGKPTAGARMGFNVTTQSKAAGSPPIQSLSPAVKGASDLDNPSLWSHVTLSNTPGNSTAGSYVSPRVFAQKPVIDGEVTTTEWNRLSLFSFGESASNVQGSVVLETVRKSRAPLAMALSRPRPIVPLAPSPAANISMKPHVGQTLPGIVMARWEYWYQADTRKAAPALHVARADHSSALAHHPLEGTGPWFSFDRAEWQRRQLMDMRQAGVDVALPVYRGAARDRQLYADKGLTVLAAALQTLRQAGQDYPQIGLFLDTDALIQTFGDRPDLREPAVQAALYDLIRDFYRRIPTEFRFLVALSPENGGHSACPVFLSDARAFKDLDGSFSQYLRGRFILDFGCDLIVMGGPGFQGKAPLDGYFASTMDKNLEFSDAGWIKIATVGAGHDSGLLEELPQTPTHRSDDKYRAAWAAAVEKHPGIVLLDGWNDYEIGREIAPSIENGYGAVDITKVYSRALAGSAKFNVKYLRHDIPDEMAAGGRYAVHIRAQNTGLAAWGIQGGVPVSFQIRWRKGGAVVAESAAVLAPDSVLAGQNFNLALTVAASARSGAPLADGDYTVHVTPIVAGENKNSKEDAAGRDLSVTVHVAANGGAMPQWAGSVVRSDLPVMMESGSGYIVDATLRNDGAATWRKGDRVTLRLYRGTPGTAGSAALIETPVNTSDASILLAQDASPGQEAAVHLLLPLVDPEGKPLPAWTQDDLWTYTARWEVAKDDRDGVRPASTAASGAEGASFGPMSVVVTAFDFGVRFSQDHTPASLPADRKQPVTLSILNAGPQTWKRDEVRIGYHWYYLDGTELRWEDALTPIVQDVPPGGRINELLANVSAPPTDGVYFLMWDVKFGDMWASTSAATHPFDSTIHMVRVVGNRLTFADLTKSYNMDGVSDSELQLGDFDGKGRSFPAEWLPPYTDAPVTPAAMWLPSDPGGPESARRISFRWGPKEGKLNNFIACRGQRIELGKSSGKCRILHIVAASTEKDAGVNLKLIFQEPTSQSEDQYAVTVSRWDQPPSHNEEVALLARRHYEKDGLKPGAVALYHYAIKVREPRKLVAIVLPNTPEIKIAAMTLEQ